jgi:hypothetical protein
MTSRMISRINGGMTSGTGMSSNVTDRQLMRAEVAMHQHMLHELTMMQSKATGMAREMVDETIPIVRQHLLDAESLWRQMGGGVGRNGNGTQR